MSFVWSLFLRRSRTSLRDVLTLQEAERSSAYRPPFFHQRFRLATSPLYMLRSQ
jgi:hypothetical protein